MMVDSVEVAKWQMRIDELDASVAEAEERVERDRRYVASARRLGVLEACLLDLERSLKIRNRRRVQLELACAREAFACLPPKEGE